MPGVWGATASGLFLQVVGRDGGGDVGACMVWRALGLTRYGESWREGEKRHFGHTPVIFVMYSGHR